MTDSSPDDPTPLLPIGELSRASGLSVSALRFYDREGLLVPADVDPHTGYRRYSPGQVRHARLLAGLRRVGMPLAEMAAVLDALPDNAVVEDLLEAHLRRLEDGLSDARREIARLRTLLPGVDVGTWSAVVPAAELARVLDAVRYAAGTDPQFPMLCGVLLEPVESRLRLVATDRFRLAVSEVEAQVASPTAGRMSVLPTADLDRLRGALWETADPTEGASPVRLTLTRTTWSAAFPDGRELHGECLDLDFPDYRRLLHDRPVTEASAIVPVAEILSDLARQDESGILPNRVALHPNGIGESSRGLLVDRTFLWEAASAAGDGHAVLPAEGVIAPLTFHGPDDELLGLLMPVRPEPALERAP